MQRFLLLLTSLAFLAGCNFESLQRSDKLLSRGDANKKISLPLPASAKDGYFLFHMGGLQEFQQFVRFSVDPDDLESSVDALLAGHRPNGPIYDPEQTEPAKFRPMSWWTPNMISNGHFRSGDSPPIYIWTDTDKNIVFVCTTD